MIDIQDEFSLMDIRRKKYDNINSDDLINDLKRVFMVVDSTPEVFVIKDYDAMNEFVKISYTTEAIAKNKLKKIVVGYDKGKAVSGWDVYLNNTLKFTVRALKFYSEKKDVFSYFRGYDYKKLDKVKMEVIQPFLDHVFNVIANKNMDIYKYIIVWIASILQRPNFKVGVALVILGKQGSGKTEFFTDIVCQLMARYANNNITNIEDIVGKFNASLENKKLIIINELMSVDMNKQLNSDALKSVITDKTVNINQKNEPVRLCENVANSIFVSNNEIPLKIEGNDRRYCVSETNDEHVKDWDYFAKLSETLKNPEFYENLFTFFMMQDLSNVNLRNIPETEAKTTIQEASMSSYELFVRENYDLINDITGPELFELYNEFIKQNRFRECSSRTFITNIKPFTGEQQVKRINGKAQRVYSLKADVYEKYKKYHDNLISQIVEDEDVHI